MSTEKCDCKGVEAVGFYGREVSPLSTQFLDQADGNGDAVLDRVAVAVITKFGGQGKSRRDTFIDFVTETKRILGDSGFPDVDTEPTLAEQLEVLKSQVGEESFKSILSNPRIESIAAHAWEQVESAKDEKAVAKLSDLFNGAVTGEDVAYFMQVFTGIN